MIVSPTANSVIPGTNNTIEIKVRARIPLRIVIICEVTMYTTTGERQLTNQTNIVMNDDVR